MIDRADHPVGGAGRSMTWRAIFAPESS